jgi:ankyrin repeat protein
MGPYGSGAHWMLEHAVIRGDAALLEWCLEHGANPNSPPAQAKRRPEMTLYDVALLRGRPEIAELLVRHGARRTEVKQEPEEAFVAACMRGDVGVVRDLLASHPKVGRASAALFAALEEDRADVVKLLLTAGMSPDVEGDFRERPLHRAAANNAIRSARILLAHGAEVDPRDTTYSNTPLAVADHFQHRDMIDFLAEYSRDVWELSYLGKLERLRAVLADDPRLARVSWENQTPLMWLPPEGESGALEVAKELVRHGADPAIVNKDGATAADRAEAMGMFKVAAYLREESAAAGP